MHGKLIAAFGIVLLPAVLAQAGTGTAAGKGRLHLAFVLLSRPGPPAGEDVVRAFAQFATDGQRIEPAASGDGRHRRDVTEFDVTPCGTAFVAAVPAPVPDGEAEYAARFSVSSMGTGWSLPHHVAHLIVTLRGAESSSRLASLSCFTSLLAAVTQASGAVGVYWGATGATHDPRFFTSVAGDPNVAARVMLWTGVSVAREPDGSTSFLSLGMQQLALPDLLVVTRQPEGAGEALETLFDLLAYVAQRGEPLPEGDTVGRTANEHLPVRYVPSPVDPDKQVWRVVLGE